MSIVKCDQYNVYINEDWTVLSSILDKKDYSRIGILVDENTEQYCLPVFLEHTSLSDPVIFRIKSGEQSKNLQSCEKIWSEMLRAGFDRHSLVINLGGGVIGDMGGFCACTFMRGMDFIQVPTTLLSQVDASVGGKLGVDFQDYKNLIGVISDPIAVWIDVDFLTTLEAKQIRSGYAEIIKHALISNAEMWDEIKEIKSLDGLDWKDIVHRSVLIKRDVVVQDKYEGGLRKILNYGHTLGHAIESQVLHREDYLLHGEAIGIGMIMEAHLSTQLSGLSEAAFEEIKDYILQIYPHYASHVSEIDSIVDKLIKDKKNRQGRLNFSLLNEIGSCGFDIVPSDELIRAAIQDYVHL